MRTLQLLTRRQMLAGAASAAAAAFSSSCASSIREDKLFNLLVHGAFTMELNDGELVLRAPALLGHVYAARAARGWYSPKQNEVLAITGLAAGNREDFHERASKTYPQIKRAAIVRGQEYWTLRLPIPVDTRGFRYIETRQNEPALCGSHVLELPQNRRIPSVVLLRFSVKDWKQLSLAKLEPNGALTATGLALPQNESLRVYAESAFPPEGNELQEEGKLYDPALDVQPAAGGYDSSGPYHDASIGVTTTDTKHLHEVLTEDDAGPEQAHAGASGNVPLGM
jgi:hypothetical protein